MKLTTTFVLEVLITGILVAVLVQPLARNVSTTITGGR